MSQTPVRHLVTVWNPSYADAMDETIQLLLGRAREHADGKRDADDVFVWWGKIKSTNRQKPLEHLKDILAIDDDLKAAEGAEREVHLYLTDYRSLYVGHVDEITADDVRKENDGGVPDFYTKNNHDCDCWFRLFDIRRLVADDTLGVVEELKKLANTRYADRPVSIYGGMVDLPIIATRKEDAHYFGDDARASLTDGQFWVEFDSQRSGVGQVERELRDNLLGESTWSALDPSARLFIATAETLFRNHRNDPAFDFAPVVIDLAKAVEVQTNTILRRGLSSVAPKDRTYIIDGTSRDIARGHMPSGGRIDLARAPFSLSTAAALHAAVFRPVIRLLVGKTRLLIVPDGVLHAPPFEALVSSAPAVRAAADQYSTARYLIDDYEVEYLPSTSFLAGRSRSAASLAGARLLVVSYDAPGAEEEARALRDAWPAASTTLLANAGATERAVREAMPKAGVIHFVVHAQASARNPLASHLQLAPDGGADGLLSISEIAATKIGARLVVLSACETDAGPIYNGEGVMGLARIFFRAVRMPWWEHSGQWGRAWRS